MSRNSLKDCIWFPFNDEPLLKGNWYVPKLCDPQVIVPSKSPDGKWHMFLHSWIGIHHFISESGIAWEPKKMIVLRGHYPFIFIENDTYYLLYEKHDYNIPQAAIRRANEKNENCSRIEIRHSRNLQNWSSPETILDSRSVPYAHDYVKRTCVSRPQLIKLNDIYRLYFGASEVVLPDSKHKTARYTGYAESQNLTSEFRINTSDPLFEPEPDDSWTNLACGSVKIVKDVDKVFALQCGYYWDAETCKSSSSALLLSSEDGLHFTRCSEKPFLMPQTKGWAEGYIKNCDVNYMVDEKCWYCYFSACSGKNTLFSKESIGLFIGNCPES